MKRLSPGSLRYAVIQMDPVAMVAHYADATATGAAQAMRPKKYLVYLNCALDLPFPTSLWFRHRVDVIGPNRPHPEPKRGITSDMAISISPNPDRPQGRSPLEPSPTFPFDNCYHWVDCSATVRIRRCEDGDGLYDDSTAPVLSTRDHVRMARLFSEDYARMDAIAAATAQGRGHQCNDLPTSAGVDADNLPAEAAPPNSTQKHASHISLSQGLYPWDRALGAPDDAPNQATDGHPGRSPSLGDLADDFHEGDFFGLTMVDDDEFAPLVDVWFDIAEHLTAASIPSPTELFKEREEMKAIILTARMRNPHVRLPPRNGELEREVHPSQGDSDAEQIVDSHDSVD